MGNFLEDESEREEAYIPLFEEVLDQLDLSCFRLYYDKYNDKRWVARNLSVEGKDVPSYETPLEAVIELYLSTKTNYLS